MGGKSSKGKKTTNEVAISPSASDPIAASYLGVSFRTNDADLVAVFNSMNSALDNYRKTGFCPAFGRRIIVTAHKTIDAQYSNTRCKDNLVLATGNVPLESQALVAASGAKPGGVLVDCVSDVSVIKCDEAKAVMKHVLDQLPKDNPMTKVIARQIGAVFNLVIDKCCDKGVINKAKCKRLVSAVVTAVCWEMSDTLNEPLLSDEPGL